MDDNILASRLYSPVAMKIPLSVADYCRANGFGAIRRAQPIGGGSPNRGVNNAARLETDGGPLFLKVNPSAPADMFEREAEGLAAIAVDGAPRVPKVLGVGPDYILQEHIEPSARRADFWETLGVQMARLHSVTSPRFGFAHNNYLGGTLQINKWEGDGYTFFAEHRLRYQAELARSRHVLEAADLRPIDSIIARLPQWIPPQPASLLHGDLWSGNVHTDERGQPTLIDPAAHYGWAEAELAMMTLFGSVPASFFGAYESVRPLDENYADRFGLYNLYHLLNHLNLFGRSYAGSVKAILKRFA